MEKLESSAIIVTVVKILLFLCHKLLWQNNCFNNVIDHVLPKFLSKLQLSVVSHQLIFLIALLFSALFVSIMP